MNIWKNIDRNYQIDIDGNIKSTGRFVNNNGGLQWIEERLLKPYKNNLRGGYWQIILRVDGKSKHYKIHRLVAFAFFIQS